MPTSIRLSLLLPLLLATACDAAPAPDGSAPKTRSCEVNQLFPVASNRDVDILFVVDQSQAAAGFQPGLAANLPAFAAVLENIAGGLPSVHIGVVSADPARGGVLEVGGGCGLHDGERFIRDEIDPETFARVRNYDGALADVLTCLASLGTNGSATAAPLAAIEASLDGSRGENAGFLRPVATLEVVVLAAQDDCSGGAALAGPLACAGQGVRCSGVAPTQPGQYFDCVAASGPDVQSIDRVDAFLHQLKADPYQVVLGVAAAPPEPFVITDAPALASSCTTGATGALPAVRLAGLVARFPNRGILTSVCSEDWTAVLQPIAEHLASTLDPSCLHHIATVDLAPDRPGLQLECAVSDFHSPGSTQEVDQVLPRCTMIDDVTPSPDGERPCWWVGPAAECSTDGAPGFSLTVQRSVDPPVGTYVSAFCVGSCE